MPLPTLAEMFGIAGPVLLRKLRSHHWGDPTDGVTDERVDAAAQAAFLDEGGDEYSFFRAADDAEALRAVLALNGTRDIPTISVSWIAFTEDEIAGLPFTPDPVGTHCTLGNRLPLGHSALTPGTGG
ncbi:MAG: hypothetical protein K2W96_23125 [Gemmataceae bacterium]|nr:hypothetical protein [Gemmataceae bacterium]